MIRAFESRLGEVYSIQHYVIKFVDNLRQVDGFLRVLRFPLPIKLTAKPTNQIGERPPPVFIYKLYNNMYI